MFPIIIPAMLPILGMHVCFGLPSKSKTYINKSVPWRKNLSSDHASHASALQSTSRKATLEFDDSRRIFMNFLGLKWDAKLQPATSPISCSFCRICRNGGACKTQTQKRSANNRGRFKAISPETVKHLEPVLAPNALRCFSRPIFGTTPGCSFPEAKHTVGLLYTIAPGHGTPAPRPLCAPECFVFEIKFIDRRNLEQLLSPTI